MSRSNQVPRMMPFVTPELKRTTFARETAMQHVLESLSAQSAAVCVFSPHDAGQLVGLMLLSGVHVAIEGSQGVEVSVATRAPSLTAAVIRWAVSTKFARSMVRVPKPSNTGSTSAISMTPCPFPLRGDLKRER